ncbi:MAG TPA: glycoside hydrolase family 2 TIM barrel-domain containing protein [Polyangiaceae bacterium]|nr:glycoside hydrolase family 2 TIM barrel-domain containing protein [Polyangiaceae bacterium]
MPRRYQSRIGLLESSPPPAQLDPAAEPSDTMGYPRPQLRREEWFSLDGTWEFEIEQEATTRAPEEVQWPSQIVVPFAPETSRSGINDTGLYRACWYRRTFPVPKLAEGERLLLHFGAVDYHATVWLNGARLGEHEGGYSPFHFDVTRHLDSTRAEQTVIVHVDDDPTDLEKPRGKQDWQLNPHSIWYPRTTGIWQTVWLERVPEVRIQQLLWTTNVERWEIGLDASISAPLNAKLRLGVKLTLGDLVLAHDHYTVVAGEVHRRIALSDPGIDDFRNELLWSPAAPRLIEAELELSDAEGRVIDRVKSYTALRTIAVHRDRLLLNGRPYMLRMVLDQGYWPETGLTPPSDAALRRDVELTKAMGFNGVRKHQKIEVPRYLYWADRLGLLVWEEMPSAYRFSRRSIERLTKQWMEVLQRDMSHPCIMAWVPFNESWGVPNLPDSAPERNYVRALYYLTKTQDPSRPVVGNDGWESVSTDIIGIHDYDANHDRIARRYWAHDVLPKLFKRERPAGRALVLEGHSRREHPIVLSEFGGLALRAADGTWGYTSAENLESFERIFSQLLKVVRRLEALSGFCYTQLTDTYQEANGLLYADRRPKLPVETIFQIVAGAESGPIGPPPIVVDAQDEPER